MLPYILICACLVSAGAVETIIPAGLAEVTGKGRVSFAPLSDSGSGFGAGFSGALPDIVRGTFEDQLDSVGWTYLILSTNASYTDFQQAYAAGYAEGAVTVNRTWQTFENQGAINVTLPTPVMDWINNNTAFVHLQILAHIEDPYWHQVALLLAQLQGIADGYNDHADTDKRVSDFTFMIMQIGPELSDLFWLASAAELEAVGAAQSRFWRLRRHSQLRTRRDASVGSKGLPLTELNHCSALVKFDAANGELYASQATWGLFEMMLRIYKTYDFPFTSTGLKGSPSVSNRVMSFSGYPASLVSGDDWYVLGPTGLVALETTIGNNNATLYELYMLPQTVPEWMRSSLSNRLSSTGAEWAASFAHLNSGTYNNEWLVIDYDRFVDGKPGPGTVTVVDQIPGFVSSEDVTYMLLQHSYFASYNVPWDAFIFNMSGNQELVEQFGPWFSYNGTSRANIFRRDAPNAKNETAFRTIMRYNNYEHDPLSREACTGNPPYSAVNAIAARADLNPENGNYTIPELGYGDSAAIDAKYTTAALRALNDGLRPLNAVIQAGPTYDNLPAFSFLNTTLNLSHIGLPDVWQMPWVSYAPVAACGICTGAGTDKQSSSFCQNPAR